MRHRQTSKESTSPSALLSFIAQANAWRAKRKEQNNTIIRFVRFWVATKQLGLEVLTSKCVKANHCFNMLNVQLHSKSTHCKPVNKFERLLNAVDSCVTTQQASCFQWSSVLANNYALRALCYVLLADPLRLESPPEFRPQVLKWHLHRQDATK